MQPSNQERVDKAFERGRDRLVYAVSGGKLKVVCTVCEARYTTEANAKSKPDGGRSIVQAWWETHVLLPSHRVAKATVLHDGE